MKYLYKYPQKAYPYGNLIDVNRRRGRAEFEYELLDTGLFDQDRYFDVFVEYAKASRARHSHPNHRVQSRSRAGGAGRAADPLVPQHVVMGRRGSPARAPAGWPRSHCGVAP